MFYLLESHLGDYCHYFGLDNILIYMFRCLLCLMQYYKLSFLFSPNTLCKKLTREIMQPDFESVTLLFFLTFQLPTRKQLMSILKISWWIIWAESTSSKRNGQKTKRGVKMTKGVVKMNWMSHDWWKLESWIVGHLFPNKDKKRFEILWQRGGFLSYISCRINFFVFFVFCFWQHGLFISKLPRTFQSKSRFVSLQL